MEGGEGGGKVKYELIYIVYRFSYVGDHGEGDRYIEVRGGRRGGEYGKGGRERGNGKWKDNTKRLIRYWLGYHFVICMSLIVYLGREMALNEVGVAIGLERVIKGDL